MKQKERESARRHTNSTGGRALRTEQESSAPLQRPPSPTREAEHPRAECHHLISHRGRGPERGCTTRAAAKLQHSRTPRAVASRAPGQRETQRQHPSAWGGPALLPPGCWMSYRLCGTPASSFLSRHLGPGTRAPRPFPGTPEDSSGQQSSPRKAQEALQECPSLPHRRSLSPRLPPPQCCPQC